MVKAIPDDYPRITFVLNVDGAADAIEFYKTVFGVTERMRVDAPDGRIVHSELVLDSSLLMVVDEFPEMNSFTPKTVGGTPVIGMIYVQDVDATHAAALAAGATEENPVETHFYGDRSGMFIDPWGHRWNVAAHVEDVDPEELARRSKEMMTKMAQMAQGEAEAS